jgi:long-chain acyl-CoA synthetase
VRSEDNLAWLLRAAADRHPERVAIQDDDTAIGYAELDLRVRKLAAALLGLGVRSGQHVALLLPNVPEFTLAYFACHYAGLPVVPLNILLTAEEIAYHLENSDAVALVYGDHLEPAVTPALHAAPRCRIRIPASRLAGMLSGAAPLVLPHPVDPDDTAVLLYTSGTTGRSKGAELTHANLRWNAEYFAAEFMRFDGPLVSLAALPLFHSFGQTAIQNATFAASGTLVLLQRFRADTALAAMRRHQVTLFAGVPTMYLALLRETDAGIPPGIALLRCISGGAPMPVEVMKSFDSRFGVDILEGYGLSETSPVAAQNRVDLPKRAGSIGLPLRGVEFRLVDEAGLVIESVRTRGELEIRGPIVMKGYYRNPEATSAAINGGWFRTGDIAERDEEGFYYIVDRKKDMVLRGGYSVYPREVEEVLYRHPAVSEAAVIGVPDQRLGEELKAFVVVKSGMDLTPAALIEYCREHLAAYKYPRTIELVDQLPRGPTGKLLRRSLRERS